MTRDDLRYLRKRLQQLKNEEGLRPTSNRTGIPVGQIRSLLSGRAALTTTVSSVCAALGLEFYIGEPRHPVDKVSDFDSKAGEKAPGWVENLCSEIRGLAATLELSGKGSTRQVEIRELAAAAGSGSTDQNETLIGHVDFQREWLDRNGIDPTQCTMISVRGDSMEPTLPEGCAVLVDRNRRRRLVDHIFVVRSDDVLLVKRAGRDDRGDWLLVSDNKGDPKYMPMAWPQDAVVIGQVVWIAKTLI